MTGDSRLERGKVWSDPTDTAPGWKTDPDDARRWRWWTGRSWSPASHPDPRTRNPWLLASIGCSLLGFAFAIGAVVADVLAEGQSPLLRALMGLATLLFVAVPVLSGVAVATHGRFGHRTASFAMCVSSSIVVGFGLLLAVYVAATGMPR